MVWDRAISSAGIIELLFRRGFLTKKGRYIHSTDAGKALFHSLPEMATRPDMTAHWESVLTQNQRKAVSLSGLGSSRWWGRYIGLLIQPNVRRCGSFAALWLRAVVAVLIRKGCTA
ncbi:hypothetical protein ACNKHX_08930 [Shigella flexneri]